MNTKEEKMFDDGSELAFETLPVDVAYLRWRRGDAQAKQLAESDPALYFGGFRAMTMTRDGEALPGLPIPIVDRVSSDGMHDYQVYATNVLEILTVNFRKRFELREKGMDSTGREREFVRAVSRTKLPGYVPTWQIFGLVFAGDSYSPAVIIVDNWSGFISMEHAGQAWQKVRVPNGQVLIRRYGNIGVPKAKGSKVMIPEFEVFGKGRSTPIRAIGVNEPRFVERLPHFVEMWEGSKAWAKCERWHAEGAVVDDDPFKAEFLKLAGQMNLLPDEVDQILAGAGGSYEKALELFGGEPETPSKPEAPTPSDVMPDGVDADDEGWEWIEE